MQHHGGGRRCVPQCPQSAVTADGIFQIQLLLRELVCERRDLTHRRGRSRRRWLPGWRLARGIDLVWGKGLLLESGEQQHAQDTMALRSGRNSLTATLNCPDLVNRGWNQSGPLSARGWPVWKTSRRPTLHRQEHGLLQESLPAGKSRHTIATGGLRRLRQRTPTASQCITRRSVAVITRRRSRRSRFATTLLVTSSSKRPNARYCAVTSACACCATSKFTDNSVDYERL